jgi:hypothetical protein
MPEPRLRAVCLAALILVPVGCAWISGSRAKGEWHPARGEPVPVTLRFDSDGRGGGRVETTLGEDGERYQGLYLVVSPETPVYRVQPLIQSWHSVWRTGKHSLEPDPWLDGSGGAMTFIRRYDGHVVAELSSGARVMRCRFELSRPGWGPRGGGPGECQLSDGSEIRAEL